MDLQLAGRSARPQLTESEAPPRALPCAICGHDVRSLYRWQGFELYRCRACATESVQPPPTAGELAAFYQARSGFKMERWERRLARVRRAFGGYLQRIEAVGAKTPERFLDLGGGVGYYARAALDRGLDACLMEWADDALAFARQELGVPWTVRGDLGALAAALDRTRFDFVLARHVIEHLPAPDRFVAEIRTTLRPAGLVQIETPNVETREQLAHLGVLRENYRILRRDNPQWSTWRGLRQAAAKSVSGINPPKHLWGFSARGLRLLLERNGFEVLDVRRVIAGHPVYDPLFYDLHRLGQRRGLGIPYFFWQRTVSNLMRTNGMNLAVLGRRAPRRAKR